MTARSTQLTKIFSLALSLLIFQCAEDTPTDTPVTYTVTFNANGGSAVKSLTVNKDAKANKPADPTKEGYAFEGWYTDQATTTAYDFDTPVTANVTLYAKWTAVAVVTFTVTFNANGGSAVDSLTVNKDAKASKPADPTRDGYTFGGWYSDQATTTAYDFDTPVTANVTLYAKWTVSSANNTEQRYTVTITYNWNAADHGPLPSGAHFTTFFAVIHNNQFLLYKRGSQLSAGMEVLAETGSTTTLSGEISSNADVLSSSTVGGEGGVQNTFSLDVVVTTQHPYISMATMIAPSPDWFIGVSSILLYENGAFKSTVSGGMNAYDGGTEEGTTFTLSNLPTTPKEPVTLLQSMNEVALDNTKKPLATYAIAKKD